MTAVPEELRARVAQALRDRQIEIASELDVRATLWLAAPPVWTRSAAEAARFPVESVTGFVRRACEAGWCETRGSAGGQGSRELRFWMPDTVRREVIAALMSHFGNARAAGELSRIAASLVSRASPRDAGVEMPQSLRAWADLVAGGRAGRIDVPGASVRVVELAQRAVAGDDLALAQDLVDAGEAISAVFGGSAEQALSRSRRLLALGRQRRQDVRALARYLDRPELSSAVALLLGRHQEALAPLTEAVTPLRRALTAGGAATRRDLARVLDHLDTLLAPLDRYRSALQGTATAAIDTVAERAAALRGALDDRAAGQALIRALDSLGSRVSRLDSAPGDPQGGEGPAPPAQPWALHLRGAGGVGKTMLVRYLASGQYARARGAAAFPVARADFDHISPDYPVRRPVQLLLELADELALHTAASETADRALASFRARAARAHEAVSGLREAGGSPLRNPEVASAVAAFGDALRELGDVLLILDTCEELAKADMGNPAAPAVRATYDIMERLHDHAPRARFLLAGRRPLPERSWLVVQPVAGFTVAEAQRYLAREYAGRRLGDPQAPPGDAAPGTPRGAPDDDGEARLPGTPSPEDTRSPEERPLAGAARRLPAELAHAMIRQSPAVDGPVPRGDELPERVSPFDLALYAAWADEDPGLTVERVDRGSDAYVEGRIIERLDDPLVIRALPVLASAGRCRVTTIAEFLGRECPEGCDATALGQSLAAQEWVDADGDPASGETVHVTARPALARRLRRYFAAAGRYPEFAARNAGLASFLASRLRATPLAGIDTAELIAALRLSAPGEAAALWEDVAGRATEPPGRWGTVLNMTRRILGEWEPGEWEDGAWPTMPALRATVTAAHIAGSRRDFALFDARGDWSTVLTWAAEHPDPGSRDTLRARAVLGQLPYAPDGPWLWASFDQVMASASASPIPDEVAAAAAATAHQLLEAGREDAAMRILPLLAGYARPGGRSRQVLAFADLVTARLHADGNRGAALEALASASHLAATSGPEPSWPDWIPPEDLRARIWIELALIAPPDDFSVLGTWESYAADHLDAIDGERLASLCLRIRLRHGVADASVAERWEALDAYVPDREPACSAHDLVPPLFVSVAEAWMSAGEPDRALDLLSRRRYKALHTRDDQVTVRHAQAATMKIARRLRIETQKSLLYQLMRDPRTRGDAWRACAVVHRESPALRDGDAAASEHPGAVWHAWWQSQIRNWRDAWVDAFLGAAVEVPPSGPGIPADPAGVARAALEHADLLADLHEMLRLGHPDLTSQPGRPQAVQAVLAAGQPARPPARSADPCYDVRAAMRRAALDGAEFTPRDGVPERLLAEMAFEEAELTALRLPEVAARLFGMAAGAYQQAGDSPGHLLAVLAAADAGAGSRRDATREAIAGAVDALARQHPDLAARLAGPLGDAGPWRYWAGRLALLVIPQAASPGSDVTRAGDPRPGQQGPASASPRGRDLPPEPGGHAPYGQVQPHHGPGEPGGARPAPRRRSVRGVLVIRLLALALTGLVAYLVSETTLATSSGSSGSAAAHPTTWTSYLPVTIVSVVAVSAVVALPALVRRVASAWQSGDRASRMAKSATPPRRAGMLATALRIVAWIARRVPSVRELAEGRGIGVTRLRNLRFDAAFSSTGTAGLLAVDLRVRIRPWRTAPARAKVALALLASAVWLAERDPGWLSYGYLSRPIDPAAPVTPLRLSWLGLDLYPYPEWWRTGQDVAPGVIRMAGLDAGLRARPWERVLSAGLSPEAAGRVEWIRIIRTGPAPGSPPPAAPPQAAPDRAGPGASQVNVLQSPTAWDSSLRDFYSPASGPALPPPPALTSVDVWHVIGEAVATSAGPAMQVGDVAATQGEASGPGPADSGLVGIPEFEERNPQLVILQATPSAAAPADGAPPGDEAERLALAAGLAEDGVPAILLLPVLPAALAPEVAMAITAHQVGREGRGDAQRLLTGLRAIIAPHVPPRVLDDIVLFLNESRYQQ